MAEFSAFNIDTGETFIRALPGEDLSGWLLISYGLKTAICRKSKKPRAQTRGF